MILLKYVLSHFSLNLMLILNFPQNVLKSIKRLFSSFFWGEMDGKFKKHCIAWKTLCKPIEEGEIGIRELEDIQTSLHMKYAWKVLTSQDIWASFFHAKYVGDKHVSLL